MQDEAFPMRRLANRRQLARAVLVFEALWRALWPAWMVAGAVLCLALLDVLPMLGGWLHAAVLLVAAVAFVVLLVHGLWRVRLPDATTVDRRLETQSGLRHRPLSVAADEPAISDPFGKALWEAHRERTLRAIRALRVGTPAPGLPGRDRRGLRFALLLCILAAFAIANVDAPSRIAAALNPVLPVSAAAPSVEVQAWITPPAYTATAPIFLRDNGPVAGIPAGSHLTVNVSGSDTTPVLALGDHQIAFKSLDGGSFQAEDDLKRGGTLSVRSRGSLLGSWALTIVADQPPKAAWGPNPGRREAEQRLRLPWDVSDDYGVTGLQAELRLVDRPDAPPLIVQIPLPGGSPKAAHGISQPDLTAHPWAGLPVIARLVARDASNQTGASAEATLRLPERSFHNPIARALIAARKTLSQHPDDRTQALSILDGLMQAPEPFANDAGDYAALSAIYYDLVRNHADQAVPESQDLMWQLALALEEGQTAETARALEEARQRARDALQDAQHQPNDATRQALQKRLEELKQAIDRHIAALLKQLQEHNDILQPNENTLELSSRDLDRMADEAEKAAREGRLDQAQRQMDQLERMLDRLRSARPASRNAENSRRQQGRNQTSAVQEMISREGGLLDHAQQRGSSDRPGDQPGDQRSAGDPNAERQADSRVQHALQRALGELMQQFTDLTGEVSPNLGAADRAMHDAQTALNQGDDASASASQQGAIAALQKGGRDMAQALARQSGQQSGGEQAGGDEGDEGDGSDEGLGMMASPDGRRDGRFGFGTLPGDPDRADSGNRDPLGRTGEGSSSATGDVQVPENREQNRTQAINNELRRRDADRQRSQEERDYINRLLKQF
jgi:uncharacterized protein (TIGR02302 family)